MSDSNRVQLSAILEATLGTTPASPRMRIARMTGESLAYKPDFQTSDEIRADRMNAPPIQVGQSNSGAINNEWHYPVDNSTLENFLQSAFFNLFTKTPSRDNDGTADSVITNVATTGTIVTVNSGAPFVASQLVRFTGFAGNSGVFNCTTGSATVPALAGSGITDEAIPPGTARLKVVGFQGGSGDITATSTGLGSTTLDFTTLGLTVGEWLKVGGTAAGTKFATAANNDWVRLTAIAAHALTFDNLPSGWSVDAGAGKTISVWMPDYIKNGTSMQSLSIERGFLDQVTPTYILQKGMVVDKMSVKIDAKQKITGSFDFLGMSGSQSQASVAGSTSAAPDPSTYPVMAASANVGRVGFNGASLASPNFVKSFDIELANNLAVIEAVDSPSPVSISSGSCDISVTLETYFGDNTLLSQLFAGTVISVNARATKGSQALIWGVPSLTLTEGVPNAARKNDRVTL